MIRISPKQISRAIVRSHAKIKLRNPGADQNQHHKSPHLISKGDAMRSINHFRPHTRIGTQFILATMLFAALLPFTATASESSEIDQSEERIVVAWKRRAPEWSSVTFSVPMFAPYNQAKIEIIGQALQRPENGAEESFAFAMYRAGATQHISRMSVSIGSPKILKSIQVPTEFLNLVKLPAIRQVEFETLSVDFTNPPPNMMIAYVNLPFGTQLVAEQCLKQELASYDVSPQEIERAIANEEWRNSLGFLSIQIFEDLSHQIEVRPQCELNAE